MKTSKLALKTKYLVTSQNPDELDDPGEDRSVDRLDNCEPFINLGKAVKRAEDLASRSNVDWYVITVYGYTKINGKL